MSKLEAKIGPDYARQHIFIRYTCTTHRYITCSLVTIQKSHTTVLVSCDLYVSNVLNFGALLGKSRANLANHTNQNGLPCQLFAYDHY